MKFKRLLLMSVFALLLAACNNVGLQVQVLSPADATTTAQPSATPQPSMPTPVPQATPAETATPEGESPDQPDRILSPDRQWTAVLDTQAGTLSIEDAQGASQEVLAAGSTVTGVKWSNDSNRLAIALSNYLREANIRTAIPKEPPEIQMVEINGGAFSSPRLIYQPKDALVPGSITLGTWSPDDSRILFWLGSTSASIQMDGLPLFVLDVDSGQAAALADTALVNLAYQSWAPDSSALVFTNGGYRSAQVGKWLSLYDVASGETSTLVPQDELVPGQVAWSPDGSAIAVAAVKADQTGTDWADYMGWDNPAILARRIYLVDPGSGTYQRLNDASNYQDAPRWAAVGKVLFYVQVDGQQAGLMTADPASGEAQPMPTCQQQLASAAGTYGQVDWGELYQSCPAIAPLYPGPTVPPWETGSDVPEGQKVVVQYYSAMDSGDYATAYRLLSPDRLYGQTEAEFVADAEVIGLGGMKLISIQPLAVRMATQSPDVYFLETDDCHQYVVEVDTQYLPGHMGANAGGVHHYTVATVLDGSRWLVREFGTILDPNYCERLHWTARTPTPAPATTPEG